MRDWGFWFSGIGLRGHRAISTRSHIKHSEVTQSGVTPNNRSMSASLSNLWGSYASNQLTSIQGTHFPFAKLIFLYMRCIDFPCIWSDSLIWRPTRWGISLRLRIFMKLNMGSLDVDRDFYSRADAGTIRIQIDSGRIKSARAISIQTYCKPGRLCTPLQWSYIVIILLKHALGAARLSSFGRQPELGISILIFISKSATCGFWITSAKLILTPSGRYQGPKTSWLLYYHCVPQLENTT